MKTEGAPKEGIKSPEQAAPKAELGRRFEIQLNRLLETLGEALPDKLQTFPRYEIDSGLGKLTVEATLFPGKDNDRRKSILLAKNEGGQIIGYREASFYDKADDKNMQVGAEIEVGQKGKGLAVPIDLVFTHFLQEMANNEQKTVTWQVINANLQELKFMKWAYKNDAGLDEAGIAVLPDIQALEEEQKRWQAVYGPGGKLGITNKRRIFVPEAAAKQDHGDIETIKLKRVEDPETHVVFAEVVEVIPSNDPAKTLEERKERIKQDIEEGKAKV